MVGAPSEHIRTKVPAHACPVQIITSVMTMNISLGHVELLEIVALLFINNSLIKDSIASVVRTRSSRPISDLDSNPFIAL